MPLQKPMASDSGLEMELSRLSARCSRCRALHLPEMKLFARAARQAVDIHQLRIALVKAARA
jgi:hypothetical protein